MDITKRVNKIVEKHETKNPFTIAKRLGIHVIHENLGNILGYYSKHFRIPIIHINEDVDEKQQMFICAHELGHAILHPDHNTSFLKKHTFFSTDKIEVEANEFAVELLFLRDDHISLSLTEVIEEYKIPKDFIQKYKIF